MNPKGGSGKTTVAMNLAAFYASDGKYPAIMDLDAQASSTRWLAKRNAETPPIHGVSPFNIPAKVTRSFAMRMPNEVNRIIVDTPAALNKQQFVEVTGGAIASSCRFCRPISTFRPPRVVSPISPNRQSAARRQPARRRISRTVSNAIPSSFVR
jgi:hypothetical protein